MPLNIERMPKGAGDTGKERATKEDEVNGEKHPASISFAFEKFGNITPELEAQVVEAFSRAGERLSGEWGLTSPLVIKTALMSDDAFREGAGENDPASWKYCFLLRDHKPEDKIYCNVDIFNVLPNDAEAIIKHETAHVVVSHLVDEPETYRNSYFLEEGTAGLDYATDKLIAKLKKDKIADIPNPQSLQTIEAIKMLGGDTNVEPFTDQLGYLVLFSTLEYLRKKNGVEKIIEVYKKTGEGLTLEEAYSNVCGAPLSEDVAAWKNGVEHLMR
jgi:hypothetical protein